MKKSDIESINKCLRDVLTAVDKELRPLFKKNPALAFTVMAQASHHLFLNYVLNLSENGCPASLLCRGVETFADDIKGAICQKEPMSKEGLIKDVIH